MDDYPEELRTPPVSLIALVGCPEIHATISSHLISEQPPIHTLALPDFSKISVLAKPPPKQGPVVSDPSSGTGILKRDWLLKHRTRVPAVVAAFFRSYHVSGDPAQWLELSSQLDNLKSVIHGRNTKMAVVVVQSTSNDDTSEDRVIALRKRAEVDPKYIIYFAIEELMQKKSLNSLAGTFAELANIYYKEEGRRIRTRIDKKSFSSVELHVRCCFKVAVYAEFRRDWAEALSFYESAYLTLHEMIGTTKPPAVQRLVEIKTVAEQLHFKISTLLLHGGKIIEAIAWFHKHNASYKKLVGPPQVIFLHWEWMSRQFLAFAELLETSSANVEHISPKELVTTDQILSEWEFYPAYYYQLAAHYLKEKTSCLQLALSMTHTINDIDDHAESVVSSVYTGQYARLLGQGDKLEMQSLAEDEYINFALTEGNRLMDSFEIIALLKKSFESYSNLKAQRMASYCGFQMAAQYFALGDFSNAKQHFDLIANLYRQEGWVTMMWEILHYLRECSRQQGLLKDFVEYSLEMAALPVSLSVHNQSLNFKDSQRECIHKDVFGLVKGEIELESSKGGGILKVTEDSPLLLEIDPVSPLRVALLASVAFHDQVVKPGATTFITLSLLTQLPLPVEIDQLEIQFNQSTCNFIIRNSQRPPLVAIYDDQEVYRVENSLALPLTNKWLRLTYDIRSEQVGKLECVSVIARIGPYFKVCCRAECPASLDGLPLWKFEDQVENFPTKDPALALSGQKFIQVEEPDPQVDLTLCATGPALVGESFSIPVSLFSRGHAVYSGELKINLVDSMGGGLISPRDLEPFSVDNPHVELLGISGSEDEDEPEMGSDGIKKIQQSFGLFSVPTLNDGDSWSCKLQIRWHRPKPVMLYVSLSYCPCDNDPSAQKLHVHKSLQIEGKTAVAVDHHFMLPFRRDALLLSRIRTVSGSCHLALPFNETGILVVSAKNCTEVPLELSSISIVGDDGATPWCCRVHSGTDDFTILLPGDVFKKVFSVVPEANVPLLKIGTVHVRWRRQQLGGIAGEAGMLTKHGLSDVNVELPPLVVSLDCPPHAVLGEPFTYFVRIENKTELLQEIKFSSADSQSFMLSGPHNNAVLVLPLSEHILRYNLVPLASGSLLLPRVMMTATRYSAGLQPTVAASTIFVFPSKREFKTAGALAEVGLCRS